MQVIPNLSICLTKDGSHFWTPQVWQELCAENQFGFRGCLTKFTPTPPQKRKEMRYVTLAPVLLHVYSPPLSLLIPLFVRKRLFWQPDYLQSQHRRCTPWPLFCIIHSLTRWLYQPFTFPLSIFGKIGKWLCIIFKLCVNIKKWNIELKVWRTQFRVSYFLVNRRVLKLKSGSIELAIGNWLEIKYTIITIL